MPGRPSGATLRAKALSAARTGVRGVAARLPPTLEEPFLGLARAARRLTLGGTAPPAPSQGVLGYPEHLRPFPAPPRIPPDWPDPPLIENPDDRTRYVESYVRPMRDAFDIDLFERLNKEYESKPVYPEPPQYDTTSLARRTRKRLLQVHRSINLADKRVLEIGCGTGYEIWFLAHHFGADAWGIDVAERRAWQTLADERTHFVWADMTQDNPFEDDFFDRVMSFVVWEHVTHPFRALQELHRIMKPGGLAWLEANLYRGPLASHLYRQINFPWPHLLFSDEVIKEFYRRRGEKARGAAWVNKLTWAQYERYFELIGFKVRMARLRGAPFDQAFYERFENVLNRYPLFDLSKDFFTVVLEKPAGRRRRRAGGRRRRAGLSLVR